MLNALLITGFFAVMIIVSIIIGTILSKKINKQFKRPY